MMTRFEKQYQCSERFEGRHQCRERFEKQYQCSECFKIRYQCSECSEKQHLYRCFSTNGTSPTDFNERHLETRRYGRAAGSFLRSKNHEPLFLSERHM